MYPEKVFRISVTITRPGWEFWELVAWDRKNPACSACLLNLYTARRVALFEQLVKLYKVIYHEMVLAFLISLVLPCFLALWRVRICVSFNLYGWGLRGNYLIALIKVLLKSHPLLNQSPSPQNKCAK